MTEWARLPQGFYGVDVFIVIMGFLLIKGFINKPEITFLQFASRKLARLYIPLAAAIILTCGLSLFCLDANLLANMGQTGISSLLGEGNFQLKRSTTGYFAHDSSLNPFLHLWYLGVTTQLFVLAYLALVFLRHKKTRTIIWVLSLTGGISLFCAILNPLRTFISSAGLICPWEYNVFSYYDTIPRVWELIAGGTVLILPEIRNRKASLLLCVAALIMILFPALSKSCSSLAIIPAIFGTVLFIKYAQFSGLNYFFSNKFILWIGSISFSLYLVHVPLIVCYKGFFFNDINTLTAVGILLVSTITAWAFFHLIEKRSLSKLSMITVWSGALLICGIFSMTDGLKNFWNTEANQITLTQAARPRQCNHPGILKGFNAQAIKLHLGWYTSNWFIQPDDNKTLEIPSHPFFQLGDDKISPSFVLMGDSHAEHLFPGFDSMCYNCGASGIFLGSIIEPFWNRECSMSDIGYDFNREKAFALIEWLKQHPELQTVIIGQAWNKLTLRNTDWESKPIEPTIENNIPAVREFFARLQAIGKQIVIIAPLPRFQSMHILSCARWVKRRNLSDEYIPDDFICTAAEYNSMFEQINKNLSKLEQEGYCHVLYPHLHMFKDGKYKAFTSSGILYNDSNHLNATESIRILQLMCNQLTPYIKP